jgi:hypothetical protein
MSSDEVCTLHSIGLKYLAALYKATENGNGAADCYRVGERVDLGEAATSALVGELVDEGLLVGGARGHDFVLTPLGKFVLDEVERVNVCETESAE